MFQTERNVTKWQVIHSGSLGSLCRDYHELLCNQADGTKCKPNARFVKGPGGPGNHYFQNQNKMAAEVGVVAQSENKFALDLYEILRNEGNLVTENLFYSPASLLIALAMTCLGARGKTAEELASVLHLIPDSSSRPNMKKFLSNLNSSSDNNTKLLTANKLFIEKGLEILKSYRAGIQEFYDSEIASVDYKERTEEVREEINKWVEQKTNDKIKGLIPPGMLSSDTRLVLVNAIYFKGLWLQPFLKEETFPGTFFVAANQKVQVQMMRQEAHFKFFESKELGCQILELPYIGSKMSMVVFLPVETDGLDSLEGKITYDNFEKSLSTLDSSRPEEVEVFLPKFKLTQQFSLNDVLSKMGASEMFLAGKADFSGITADSLYVSQVVHKAFIEVNEEGTEAAAATGIGVKALSLMPMFNADHPFLFFIRHSDTGAILFMGRLLKPSED